LVLDDEGGYDLCVRSASCSLVVVVLVACGGHRVSGGGTAASAASCPDASNGTLVPPRDAGPACVVPGGGACPQPDAGAPDPANWGCYTDRDCAVFPELPYCDGNRCVGPAVTVTCVPNAPQASYPNPEVRHTRSGINGTFSDHCDSNGNLIDYECEGALPPCNPALNGCDVPLVNTGRVIQLPKVVDCLGTCRDGRCDSRCPQQGDVVTFTDRSPDGREILRNDTDGRSYVCSVEQGTTPGGNVDCANVAAGQTGFIRSGGALEQQCTGADFGGFGVVLDGIPTPPGSDTCVYSCSIEPPTCGSTSSAALP
jgi:hypothetical protein